MPTLVPSCSTRWPLPRSAAQWRRADCRGSRLAAPKAEPAASRNWLAPRAALRRRPGPRICHCCSTPPARPGGRRVCRVGSAPSAAALAHVAQNLYCRGERTLGVMPLYHAMGVRSLLAMALVDGAFICQHHFDAAAALRHIARERITSLYLVPTLCHDLVGPPGLAVGEPP